MTYFENIYFVLYVFIIAPSDVESTKCNDLSATDDINIDSGSCRIISVVHYNNMNERHPAGGEWIFPS